ncbi:receptor-type tyrosine-protein phosphatase T-like [Dreissena polymorpha]|uniref:receptor-type tyrosine-protein phosphatase T-like n=1 Tax=Dreissena polymorpha TaxID=45954 RepID=UPI0022652360|nr:receptor-type tyrosine-protein phosphatase T-like [Dreissena polymorpha]
MVTNLVEMGKDKQSVSRVVTHFHYTAWPDKDVPTSTSSLLHFWRRIRAHDPDKKQPWVVHCSAGVGRTGTFIAMDILIDEGQARQTVDIYACVTKLRQQRVNMVQTATEASYHTLELAGANIKDDPYSVATMPENAKKNRFDAILPNNQYRAMLTVPEDGRNDYINAVYMPSYKVDSKYILTQKPLSDTVVDCWRLIEARDIGLVVTFTDEGNEQERTVTQLLYQKWPRRQMAPPNVGEFLMLMDAVENRTQSSAALIQCLDGTTRSGLLLVLLYATECMSKDGEVSMPMVIRHLRTRRPQLIPNFMSGCLATPSYTGLGFMHKSVVGKSAGASLSAGVVSVVFPQKRVSKHKGYSPSAMMNAYKMVMETGAPVKTAARQYGVPHNTLRDRVKGRVDPQMS